MDHPGRSDAPQATPAQYQYRIKNETDLDGASSDSESSHEDTLTSDYEPRPSLPQPTVSRKTMTEFMALLNSRDIQLNPQYQRDVVWPHPRMVGLIDSLMENFFVPPVIFNLKERVDEDGCKRPYRVCVDGKQRLSSIQAFMEGRIGCHDKNGKTWYFTQKTDEHGNIAKPARARILPPYIREQFSRKYLVCYEFLNLEAAQEEDCFARVQLGVPLTTAEKSRAKTGPWQECAKRFEDEFVEVIGLADCKRSRGFNNLLGCFAQILEVQNPSKPDGQPAFRASTSSINTLTQNPNLLTPEVKSHLVSVFRTFRDLVAMDAQVFESSNYATTKAFAPVELVACSALISMNQTNRDISLLLEEIKTMRQTLREQLADLRLNGATWKVVWRFLATLRGAQGIVENATTPKEHPHDVSHGRTNVSDEVGLNDIEPDPVPNRPSTEESSLPKKRLTRFSTSSGRSRSTQLPAFSDTSARAGQSEREPHSPTLQTQSPRPISNPFLERSPMDSVVSLASNYEGEHNEQVPFLPGQNNGLGHGVGNIPDRTTHLPSVDTTSDEDNLEERREKLARFVTKIRRNSGEVDSPHDLSHPAADSESSGKSLKRNANKSHGNQSLPRLSKRAKEQARQ